MIKVLIIDDSAVARAAIKDILDGADGIEVVGTAADPFLARGKVKKLQPDVITLDVEMPKMDGITFLEKLMRFRPIPTVMISSLTQRGAATTLKALSLGAVDFVGKPDKLHEDSVKALADEVIEKIRTAATSKVKLIDPRAEVFKADRKISVDEVLPMRASPAKASRPGRGADVVCIGASTGGTQALEWLFRRLSKQTSGIVVVQHMPKAFTGAFAERLDGLTEIEVVEATTGMAVERGRAIIAPGDRHMLLQKNGVGFKVELRDGPRVSRHKPSVDVLFRSAANSAGRNALGLILTGMGDDGAKGMKDMHDSGSPTIAQDEESCVVFGMPRVAIELGAVDRIAPLQKIPDLLHQMTHGSKRI